MWKLLVYSLLCTRKQQTIAMSCSFVLMWLNKYYNSVDIPSHYRSGEILSTILLILERIPNVKEDL